MLVARVSMLSARYWTLDARCLMKIADGLRLKVNGLKRMTSRLNIPITPSPYTLDFNSAFLPGRTPLWSLRLPARLRPVGVEDCAPEGRVYNSERPEASFPLPNSTIPLLSNPQFNEAIANSYFHPSAFSYLSKMLHITLDF